MPLGDIAGGFLGGYFDVFTEILFELLIKGLGYLICRGFLQSINSAGVSVLVVGVIAWLFIIVALYSGFGDLAEEVI